MCAIIALLGKGHMNRPRRSKRVSIERKIRAVSIDGTWFSAGRLGDISEGGAKLYNFGDVNERMRSEEFFVMFTPDASVTRRAKLLWEFGRWIGVGFVAGDRSSLS